MRKREAGLHALYARDPLAADAMVFGRRSDALSRRGFLSGLGAMSAALGAEIVFHPFMPAGLIPAALADSPAPFVIEGKDGRLLVLNDRPLSAETPPHLLDDEVTPTQRMFIRNNGLPPTGVDADAWRLSIGGESVRQSRTYSIAELRQRFETVSLQITIECAGNGRVEFLPPTSGNQWTLGAVGCPSFEGVRLREVLEDCGIGKDAVYIGYVGADTHLSGEPGKLPISRGVPIAKALEAEAMIAWGMNGAAMHPQNGHPLRLVIGGWPGSVCGKWLTGILVRDRIHDGPKMEGDSYRLPCEPVEPGAAVPTEPMCIIESMPVKSLVTRPQTGLRHPADQPLLLRGHAWAGDREVREMHWSIDFGQTWQAARLAAPANRFAWQHWQGEVRFPGRGYYEIWARATDDAGVMQPMVLPGWNPKGYLNNATHRVAVYAV